MSVLDDLISQISDKTLKGHIAAEVDKLAKQKKFGLIFEEHLPECTPLYDIPNVKKGRSGWIWLKVQSVIRFCTAQVLMSLLIFLMNMGSLFKYDGR